MATALTETVLAAHGVPDPAAVLAAAGPLVSWLGDAAADAVAAGLAEAADPVAAVTGLARLLDAHPEPPPAEIAALLRILGGSPALATALAGEGAGWPALFATVLAQGTRPLDEHAAMLTTDE